jgi:hypothetical protein
MNKNLNKLTKKELLEVISKMSKKDLIMIINNKLGGAGELIKNTSTSTRTALIFDKNKKNKILSMANDELYLNNN